MCIHRVSVFLEPIWANMNESMMPISKERDPTAPRRRLMLPSWLLDSGFWLLTPSSLIARFASDLSSESQRRRRTCLILDG